MRVIDGGLQMPYVVEARRKAFEDFVRGKSLQGYPGSGMRDVALHNFGHADSFGPVTYEKGLYNGRWIMPEGGENSNVLLFTDKRECLAYGKSLLSILSLCGYFHCRVVADAVVVHISFPTGYYPGLPQQDIYEDHNYYVLRIRIRR